MAESLVIIMVPEVGIEPTRSCPRGILSPVRLPVSPLRQKFISYRKNSSPVNLYSTAQRISNFFLAGPIGKKIPQASGLDIR
jgi:hypothetical protein